MQFSFKRPQSYKSHSNLPHNAVRDRSPLPTPNLQNPPTFELNNQNKKWEQAAEKINKEMVYQRVMHTNSQSYKLLTRIGGRTYNSLPKETSSAQSSKNRIRISSKEKGSKQILRETRDIKIMEQDFNKEGKSECKLKRKKRGELFRGMPLEKELKITNIFYENPVVKIGYNMQFQAQLRLEHISQIRPENIMSICRNSIIFFLKDAPFSPNIISEKNEKMPISLSLFPQFFDSKLSISHVKRQAYLEKMLSLMNNTYDPERMSKIPPISQYPPFKEEEYFATARQLINGGEENYPPELIEGIVKLIKINLSPSAFKTFVRQQWSLWSLGTAMSNLDYILKDPKAAKKLDLVPYLPTRVTTSKKILYHGGYCKSIYTSWNSYVQAGKKRLASKLTKYNNIIQAIHGWYSEFQDVLLYEPHFVNLLNSAVSIDLFHRLQMIKIKCSSKALEQIWFRGALCLYHFRRFLLKNKRQYHSLVNYKSSLKRYIEQAKKRASELSTTQEKNKFYSSSYENFISSLRKDSNVASIEELLECFEITQSSSCDINNIQVLLNVQLARTIQNSFRAFETQLTDVSTPLIRLNLIIDRQTIKFMQQQQQIVNTFLQIISAILNTKIEGFNLTCNFQFQKVTAKKTQLAQIIKQSTSASTENEVTLPEYPQITVTTNQSSEGDKKLSLFYKTGFIFDKNIRELVDKVREYYRECYSILADFETYLPFIKLTTTQKLFGDNEGQAETALLKNLKIIARYKQSIKLLQKRVKINLFEVDCSIPIKILEERINEIQYIIEQNYINIMHQRIEAMDSELNSFKIDLHDLGMNLGGKEAEDKLIALKSKMEGLQSKSKRVAEMVMFCLDNKRKMESIIACYCQLVLKKQDLQKELQRLFLNLQLKKPEFQAEQQALLTSTFVGIDKTIRTLSETEATPFELSNLPEHLSLLKGIQEKLQSLEKQINRCQQWAPRSSTHSNFPQKKQFFQREKQRFTLAQQFWQQYSKFASYYKQVAKLQARKIKFDIFSSIVEAGQAIIQKVKQRQQKWLMDDSRIKWKPVIHATHQYYYNKFQNDLKVFRQIQPYLQILTNHKIKDRHWTVYSTEQFRTITCRQLSKLEKGYKWSELSTMNAEVNFEYEIYLCYEDIEKQIRSHCLLIVDLNNSDVLDLDNIRECLQFLHNIEIEIQLLTDRDVNGYYAGQLLQLKEIALVTQKKLKEWLKIQQKYIKYLKYHIANEEHQNYIFQNLLELHRKLIKSYDIDNSILFIRKNIVMDTYLSQINEELEELDNRINSSLDEARQEYSRLYLLSDEELFAFMSNGSDVESYLRKLFPKILKFQVNEGTIEKVGLKQELVFTEPLYFQETAGKVSTWVSALEENIKLRMKQFYKTGILLKEGESGNQIQNDFFQKRPLQLSLLEECLKFTEVASEKGFQGKLADLIADLNEQIQYTAKQTRQTNKILLLILHRAWTEKLTQTQPGTFDWQKIPQFVRRGSMLEPRIIILGQQYAYGFNYLEQCELIFTEQFLLGNCLVGQRQTGKTSVLKHYSYLCGQQLLQFNPLHLLTQQNPTAQLLSFFRVAVSTGSWLLIKRIDQLVQEQLSLIAECMIAITQGIKEQVQKIPINGLKLNLNKNSRIFMSIETLVHQQMPARLVSQLRPIWITPPNKSLLLSIYLQSKCLANAQTGKLLNFFGWLEDHDELRLQILSWLRREENPDLFVGSSLLHSLTQSTIFKSSQCQLIISYLKNEESSLSGQEPEKEHMNLPQQLSKNPVIAIYGPPGCGKTRQIIKIIGSNYMFLNNQTCLSDEQFFKQIRGFQKLSKQSKQKQQLILKNSLSYWPLIKNHLTDYRVVMIEQDLSQLHIGLLYHFKLLDFNNLLRQNIQIKNPSAVQLLLPKIVPIDQIEQDIYQLINTPHCSITKIITKLQIILHQNYFQGISIHQVAFQFLQLLRAMINAGYESALSFAFSIIWTYGFAIEEKRLEETLKQISMSDNQSNKAKFAKLPSEPSNKLLSRRKIEEKLLSLLRSSFAEKVGPLAELIPLKNGSLVSSSQASSFIGTLIECQLFYSLKVSFKSSFIFNLKLVRQLYPGAITLDTCDWLTTFLRASSPNSRYCNFGKQSLDIILKQLFKDTKKNGNFFRLPNPKIIVDDLHLCHQLSLGRLKDLFEYGFISFESQEKLNIYKTQGITWTLGTKYGFPGLRKSLTVRVGELILTTIFNEYIQSYCQQRLQVDRSVFCLLNLSSNINRFYRDLQQDRYFWFKNPLILLQKAGCSTLTQLIETYFDYLIEILPEESISLQVQRNMLELNQKEAISDIQSEESIAINTTSKVNRFLSENAMIEQLLLDNQILQEIQAKQIQPIFFQKFVRNYFTKDLLNYTKKINKHLEKQNLVILYNRSHPVHRIVRYAVKLSKLELVPFTAKQPIYSNKVILVQLDQLDQVSLEEIQELVKNNIKSCINLKIIIVAQIDSPKTKEIFMKYAFLKSYLFNIVIPPFNPPSAEPISEKKMLNLPNIVEENWENTRQIQKLQTLIAEEGLDSNFREQFQRLFEIMRKKELSKFQFYRKVTSQMVLSLDKISKALAEIPGYLSNLKGRQALIKISRRRAFDDSKDIKAKINHWQNRFKKTEQIMKFKSDEEVLNFQKLIQNAQTIHQKLDKIQKKIEAQQNLEYMRLKNNLKNNQNAGIVQNLHHLLGFIYEKAENYNLKDKGATILNAFSAPNTLALFLKTIRKREDYQTPGEDSQKVTTSLTKGRIHHISSKIEQIQGSIKKYEKVSLIYKSVVAWISLFNNLSSQLGQFFQRQEQIQSKILSDLSQLSEPGSSQQVLVKMSKELQLINEQAKRNLIQCEQRLHLIEGAVSAEEKEQKMFEQLLSYYDERLHRLERISEALSRSEYMKKVSSAVSLYFKHMEEIVFARTLSRVSLTQFQYTDENDLQFLRGIYTFREDLFQLRQKTGTNGPLKELQILQTLITEPNKPICFVEDKQALFKSKIVDLAQEKGYFIKSFTHSHFDLIVSWAETKISEHPFLLILHQNIYYLQSQRDQNKAAFFTFADKLLKLTVNDSERRILYVTNYLPTISTRLYSKATIGRITVSRLRLFNDLCDSFQILTSRDHERDIKTKNKRSEIEVVIKQRNSKIKELLSNIEVLANSLQIDNWMEILKSPKIQTEKNCCEVLENNFVNLEMLQYQLQLLEKSNTNFYYLPSTSWHHIEKELDKYYLLFKFTDFINCNTNNQLSSSHQLYNDWNCILKNLREERITLFTRSDTRPIINEIMVKGENQEINRKEHYASRFKIKQEEEVKISDMVLNHNFRKHNLEIFNQLAQKIIRGASWIERASLVQYVFGIVAISALSRCGFSCQQLLNLLLKYDNITLQQIEQRCQTVLKSSGCEQYTLTSHQGSYLIFQLDRLVTSGENVLHLQAAIFLGLYYNIAINPHLANESLFVEKFNDILNQKGTFSYRYSPLKLAYSVKLIGQVAIRLTEPMSLSLNFQGRPGQRERLITVIEQQRYLVNQLIDVLRVKALSRKRQFVILLVNMQNKAETLETLKTLYCKPAKYWVYLANLAVNNNWNQLGTFLQEIIQELNHFANNPSFRIFLVGPCQQQGVHFFYNKFQVSRLKSSHLINDDDYYKIVNQLVLENIAKDSARKTKQKTARGQEQGNHNLGLLLIEQLIVSTINEEQAIAEQKLGGLLVFYKKITKKHNIFYHQDCRIVYRKIVDELTRLGYLQEENDDNFCQFLASYFSMLPNISQKTVKQYIEAEKELCKEGLFSTIIFNPQEMMQKAEVTATTLERVNLQKIEEYFKNINSEFGQMFRREIMINNRLLSEQIAAKQLIKVKFLPKAIINQAKRNYQMKFGAEKNGNEPSPKDIRQKLPLIKFLTNIKLKQICTTKKVEITTPHQFYNFLTAYQFRLVRDFMERQINPDDIRYSSVQFGNYIHTRDYLSKMKVVLIDEETFKQINLVLKELVQNLEDKDRVEGRFALTIRRGQMMKVGQLRSEWEQVQKILENYTCTMLFQNEIVLQIGIK